MIKLSGNDSDTMLPEGLLEASAGGSGLTVMTERTDSPEPSLSTCNYFIHDLLMLYILFQAFPFFSIVGEHKADTMTGGISMYIHSYQIHNVLNVYRKQLSHGSGGKGGRSKPEYGTIDRISISPNGQRQSIMDLVSSEIVERITRSGPHNPFESLLAERLSKAPRQAELPSDEQNTFKYTMIDEQNRKRTQKMTIQGFGPQSKRPDSLDGDEIG